MHVVPVHGGSRRFISKDTDDFIQSEQYYTQPILTFEMLNRWMSL